MTFRPIIGLRLVKHSIVNSLGGFGTKVPSCEQGTYGCCHQNARFKQFFHCCLNYLVVLGKTLHVFPFIKRVNLQSPSVPKSPTESGSPFTLQIYLHFFKFTILSGTNQSQQYVSFYTARRPSEPHLRISKLKLHIGNGLPF